MPIPRENILNLKKSRQRAIYWRQDGQGNWVQTTPLPADPASMNYYFMKGFKGKKPDSNEKLEVKKNVMEASVALDKAASEAISRAPITCPTCGFEAKSDFGLKAHQRKHKKEEKNEFS